MVRDVLNSVPIAVLLLAAVALTIAVVVGGVWLVRRKVPSTKEGFHAEISAPMLGVVAALFGLLLAFVIITAYENYIEAGNDVNREADSLASIVRDSTAFPHPDGERVRPAVRTYVRTVVDEEWEQMREGRDSLQASRALDGVFAALQAVEPTTPAATGFYDDSVRQLNDALDARRDRLAAARGGLPFELAALIVFSSLVIIGYAPARRLADGCARASLQLPLTRAIILGGGFAGVGAAQRLKDAAAEVVLVDRHDYHAFQPLLDQLATGHARSACQGTVSNRVSAKPRSSG